MATPPRLTGAHEQERLGDRLVGAKRITVDQLAMALSVQRRTKQLLGRILIEQGFLEEPDLAKALSAQAGMPYVELKSLAVADETVRLLSEEVARRYSMVPIDVRNQKLRLALADPFDVFAIDAAREEVPGYTIVPCCSAPTAVQELLDRVWRPRARFDDSLEVSISKAEAFRLDSEDLNRAVEAAPVVELVNALLARSVAERATDLHIEPEAQVVQFRIRVDGKLRQLATLPKRLQQQVVARLKIMASLNITETRIPQDGRITFELSGRRLDMRVSTMLTNHGENVVVRVLDRQSGLLRLVQLGMSTRNLEVFSRAIAAPSGLILVTGPTGSGKTTTLYAALNELNSVDVNIMTLEDPIEYEMPQVRQSNIQPKAGLTYAVGLRAILRQDPDVLLVGEMRDEETTEMALRAALTGHLVLSTLHTNSAIAAIPRLLDLGGKASLVSSSLICVVAQRLVRKLCTTCRRPEEPTSSVAREDLERTAARLHVPVRSFSATGCEACSGAGYFGRLAVHEVLELTPAARDAIQWSPRDLESTMLREGHLALYDDGLEKVLAGETSYSELEQSVERAQREPTSGAA